MKCQRCGMDIEKLGHNQKYCLICAAIVRRATMKAHRERYKAQRPEKHCPNCGAVIAHNRHYCDNCLAERKREYNREYQRRRKKKTDSAAEQ